MIRHYGKANVLVVEYVNWNEADIRAAVIVDRMADESTGELEDAAQFRWKGRKLTRRIEKHHLPKNVRLGVFSTVFV